MKKLIWLLSLAVALLCVTAQAADFTLKWDATPNATGYRIYRSVDMGATWTMVQEVGAVTEYTLTGQPDALTLYRAGAFNGTGEVVRYTAGVFNWESAPQPPAQPTGAGIQ
jgi:hypothetical protein